MGTSFPFGAGSRRSLPSAALLRFVGAGQMCPPPGAGPPVGRRSGLRKCRRRGGTPAVGTLIPPSCSSPQQAAQHRCPISTATGGQGLGTLSEGSGTQVHSMQWADAVLKHRRCPYTLSIERKNCTAVCRVPSVMVHRPFRASSPVTMKGEKRYTLPPRAE